MTCLTHCFTVLRSICNLTAHTFQSQRHSRLLTEFGTHSVACPLFSSRVDTCKCWKWHWYVCFPVKCKERVKCRSGESFRLCLFFFFFYTWMEKYSCVSTSGDTHGVIHLLLRPLQRGAEKASGTRKERTCWCTFTCSSTIQPLLIF